MEIKSNQSGNVNNERIDFTRANREAIRQNLPAETKSSPAQDGTTSKRIKNAREEAVARETHYRRMSNMRDHFRASEAAHEKRAQMRASDTDSIDVSRSAQELAETTLTPRATDVDSADRAKRVSELKAQFEKGTLNVESLVAETAYRMLGGE